MKGFNYKFTDQLNKNIDDIERQPAYKRLGISLDETDSTISKSKTSLARQCRLRKYALIIPAALMFCECGFLYNYLKEILL